MMERYKEKLDFLIVFFKFALKKKKTVQNTQESV